jgi:hypothetical protein
LSWARFLGVGALAPTFDPPLPRPQPLRKGLSPAAFAVDFSDCLAVKQVRPLFASVSKASPGTGGILRSCGQLRLMAPCLVNRLIIRYSPGKLARRLITRAMAGRALARLQAKSARRSPRS